MSEAFYVVLKVTARNFTVEEAEAEGFDLEAMEADEFEDAYDPDHEPIDEMAIGECMAASFHEENVREMLAGSGLMCTVDSVSLVRTEAAKATTVIAIKEGGVDE